MIRQVSQSENTERQPRVPERPLDREAQQKGDLQFPLKQQQVSLLRGLSAIVQRTQLPDEKITADFLHRACFGLFADKKAHGGIGDHELAINCYLIASCMGKDAWIKAGKMTRICAKMMWLNRGVMLFEMNLRMPARMLSSKE